MTFHKLPKSLLYLLIPCFLVLCHLGYFFAKVKFNEPEIVSHKLILGQAMLIHKNLRYISSHASGNNSAQAKIHPQSKKAAQPKHPSAPFLLARIVGNALPPRHHPNQTLANLLFILENEMTDPSLHKVWILNRIIDSVEQQRVIDLLEKYKCKYLVIPFSLQEYSKFSFNLFSPTGESYVHNQKFYYLDEWQRFDIKSNIYDAKNIYVMGINRARNYAINFGVESGYQWILPFDQNCFLTKSAWKSMKKKIMSFNSREIGSTSSKYLISYMDRIHGNNNMLLRDDYQPNPWAEPQILFRNDSIERFDESLRYGRRDKCSLLIRLRVPGPWMGWGYTEWEKDRTFRNYSSDFNRTLGIPHAGWVARLNSGRAEMEQKGSGYIREIARAKGVFHALDKLDKRVLTSVVRYNSKDFLCFSKSKLFSLKSIPQSLILKKASNKMLMHFKSKLFNIQPTSKNLVAAIRGIPILSLGYSSSNDPELVKAIIYIFRIWFVDSKTHVSPLHVYSDINNIPTQLVSIGEYMPTFLDCVRLLRKSHSLDQRVISSITMWLKSYFEHLKLYDSYVRKLPVNSLSPVYYDIQIASLASYLNDMTTLYYQCDSARARMLHQFYTNGEIRQPSQDAIGDVDVFNYKVLEAWVAMASIALKAGINLWKFDYSTKYQQKFLGDKAADGFLCKAMRINIPCCNSNKSLCSSTMLKSRNLIQKYSYLASVALKNCPRFLVIPSCESLSIEKVNTSTDIIKYVT